MENLLHRSKSFFSRNASTILTCVGGVGVVATTILAVKATPKALKKLEETKEEKGEELTKLEVIRVAGPAYIPTIVTGAATIACVFGANVLNQRKQAALISAYALLDNSYKEYRVKVKELYGGDADDKVRDEIAKDKYKDVDMPEEDGKQLFFDTFSGQYFKSTIEDVQKAEYNLNRELSMHCSVTLNEFYDFLKIPHIPSGDELGWSSDSNFECYWQSWIDFSHRKVTLDDGQECCIITMWQEPMLGYYDY